LHGSEAFGGRRVYRLPPAVAAVAVFLAASAAWLTSGAIRDSGVMKFGVVSGEEVLTITYLFFLAVWATGYDFWAKPSILGIAPVSLVYALIPLAFALSSILSMASVSGLGEYAAAMGSVLPALVWTLLALRGHRSALALGGLIICFSASRFSGDVLRDRLVGLEYRSLQPDILAIDAVLLASVLVPDLSPMMPIYVACAATSWLALSLVLQFSRTTARIREVTGVALFQPVPRAAAASKRPAFARPPLQIRRRSR